MSKIKIIVHLMCALVLISTISLKQDIQAKTKAKSDNNPDVYQEGVASWYGPGFQGRKTANGERFNTNDLTAAHKTLPFNTIVKVTNVSTGLHTVVRINDRGPFTKGRVIDLSKAAKEEIGMGGLATVQIEIIDPEKEKEENLALHLFNDKLPEGSRVFIEFIDSTGTTDIAIDNLNDIFNAEKVRIKILTPDVDPFNAGLHKRNSRFIDITQKVNSLNGYTIEVASLLDLSNASELIERLESENFNTIFLEEINRKDSKIYKIFVGNFNDMNDSEKDLVKLSKLDLEKLKLIKIGS